MEGCRIGIRPYIITSNKISENAYSSAGSIRNKCNNKIHDKYKKIYTEDCGKYFLSLYFKDLVKNDICSHLTRSMGLKYTNSAL